MERKMPIPRPIPTLPFIRKKMKRTAKIGMGAMSKETVVVE